MDSGSTLMRYREVATLGRGGTASVVLAEDSVLGREVALKRMDPAAMDGRAMLRLRREALIGASMSHPNLVSIYDVIEGSDGSVTIVMEYVEGETLRAALKRDGQMAPPEALRVLRGIAAGLDAIHARGIVHRDVKPANILLGTDGRVKLADLGIASVPDHTRITTAGTVLGSFRYMAPEQLKDGPATRAIDIYALAAVAFEVLSGRQARREDNPLAVAHAINTQPPPDLRAVWPQAPAQAAEAIECGMCRDPAGRPASAGELVRELEAALEPTRMAPVASLTPRRPRGAAATGGAVGAAAGAAILGGGATRPTMPPRQAAAPAPRPAAAESTATSNVTNTYRTRSVGARALAPLALVLGVAVVLFALLSGGQSSSTARRSSNATHTSVAKTHTSTAGTSAHTTANNSTSTGTSTPPPTGAGASSTAASTPSPVVAPPPAASPAAAPGPQTPTGAVQAFYELAASHRYSQAWALADPAFRNQLGGYDSFVSGQSADRAIIFNTARTIERSAGAATVYVRTTSVRTTGTQRCSGSVQLVSGGSGGWLLHQISISCS